MNKRPSEGRSSAANIGFVDTGQKRSPAATKRHPHAIETIANLAFHTGYGATAWTALDSNLGMQAGSFFVNAAMRFLENHEKHESEAYARVLEYVRQSC